MSEEQTKQFSDAAVIRAFIRSRYLEPARQRRETLVTLRAGDIHRELRLRNRVPSVCQVMESKLLEKEAGVKVSSKQGPPSGRGTTFTVTYAIDLNRSPMSIPCPGAEPASLRDHPGVALFYALRGSGAGLYDDEGGGEAWLNRERESFYGPEKKDTL